MNSWEHGDEAKTILGLFGELTGPGGIQEAGRATAGAIAKIVKSRGWTLRLFSLNDPRGESFLQYDGEKIPVAGFERSRASFVLAALARTLTTRGDIIIVAAHPNLAVPAAYIKGIFRRPRIIVMAHGIEVWGPLSKKKRRALRGAQMVLAPSNYTAVQLADVQLIPKSKISRLPWPLSPDFLRLADASSNLPLPKGFPKGHTILTVGRWASAERYKGTDELILAAARLLPTIPDLHLIVVGNGDDLSRLREVAAEQEISSNVHFFEDLSKEEVAACYRNAQAFALPSTGEGFGLVFLEAMAFGKPLIAANAGGTIDLVHDGVNGLLVAPHDIEQLTRSLKRLLEDVAFRKQLGDCGAATVRQHYQFEAFRRELEKLLCDATAKSP